jgi:hypothetical protein
MLFPSISIPQSFITAAVLQGSYEEEDPPRGRLSLWMRLFFEFPGGTTTMLPANRMQARLDFDVESLAMPASDSVRMFFETGEYSTSPSPKIRVSRQAAAPGGAGSKRVDGAGQAAGSRMTL